VHRLEKGRRWQQAAIADEAVNLDE